MIPTKDNHRLLVISYDVMIIENDHTIKRPVEVDGYTAFVKSLTLCGLGFQIHLVVSALYPLPGYPELSPRTGVRSQ
jgi:hypothetical protein